MRRSIAHYLAGALPLLGGCGDTDSARQLIHNVNGYTWQDGELVQFNELLIDAQGRVAGTGSDGHFDDDTASRRYDGGGKTLLPGLIDAHAHPLGLGHTRQRIDLRNAGSLAEALAQIDAYAQANPDKPWILGRGWNQELWPDRRFPDAAALDRVVADRPVWLRRIDGHAGWANSMAMSLAGIDVETVAPSGGAIHRDDNGRPTGIFIDRAMGLVEQAIPPPTAVEDRQALELAIDELNRLGLTGVHEAGVSARTANTYRQLADEGRLTVRTYVMLSGSGEHLEAISEPVIGYADDRLEVRSVKLYADGALGSRGAALLAPYDDRPDEQGLLFKSTDELAREIATANNRGFQVAVHAIGDRANHTALDAFANVQDRKPSPLRNRIEHAQVVALEDLPRFHELGIIASMQPTHATSDMNMAEDRVGAKRIQGAYAWRRFLDLGVPVAAGSDFPVESPNPFYGIYAAVTRQDLQGQPEGGWYPGQRMTVAEAVRAFTLDAAYAAHQEDRVGSLEPGKWADFILIDRDIFARPPAELWQVQVLETWVAGQLVYRASAVE